MSPGPDPDVATRADVDARAALEANTRGAPAIAQKQADSWLKGLTAFTGVLTTVGLLKGPSAVGDYDTTRLGVVLILLVLGFLGLMVAIWLMYSAAYGRPGEIATIAPSPLPGLADRVTEATRLATLHIRETLRYGVTYAGVSVAVIFAATILTLVPQPTPAGGAKTVCLYVAGQKVATISGASVPLAGVAAGTTLGAC